MYVLRIIEAMNQTIPFETAVMMFVQQHREKKLDGVMALVKTDRADEETKWITVNGTHVPLEQNGTARAGG